MEQTDVAAVPDTERVQVRRHAGQLQPPLREQRFESSQPRSERVVVVVGRRVRPHEHGHAGIIYARPDAARMASVDREAGVALAVLLRGLNVGGHRRVRPAELARELRHLDVTTIGATGAFIVRRPITPARLRAEVARRLPFGAVIVICRARDLARLVTHAAFRSQPVRHDLVRFVSVLEAPARRRPPVPLQLPARGRWLVKVLAREGRFVLGVYRREMRVIGHLGELDRVFGVPATTRSWRTLASIAAAVPADAG
ncbi:MAG: DUF1697 domain-containing protein [Acidobacteriota bacterium]